MLEVTKYQRVEMNDKTYNLVWYGDKARVSVETKKGPRTLNGRGKANHISIAAQVIAKAREEA